MSDTPTTNWCTLNPLVRPGNTAITDGNLVYSTSIAEHALSTFGVTEGKWYCEVTLGGTNCFLGLVNSTHYRLSYIGSTTLFAVADNNSEYSPNSTRSFSSLSSFTTGDVIGFALDATSKTCDVYKNNSKVLTYDTFTLDGPYFFAFDRNAPSPTVTHTVNFGQRAFAYTPPTGFNALNTSNLPAPTVKDGSDYFNTSLWTGTGSPVAVTGIGFQPDLVWVKARSRTADHKLQDSVRGSFRYLQSNLTNAENTNSANDWFRSFDSDGFTVAQYTTGGTSTSEWAGNGDTYVGWSWLAANGTSTNTDGSITSTVSANPTAGFSIVSYTGTNSSATVGHGLGVELAMYIVKDRDNGNNWAVYHQDLGNTTCLFLDTNAAQATASSTYWNNTSPTSTTFSIGNNARTGAARDYIAYCFAEVEGYSKFGSYTANASLDGPCIYCGFKPALIIFKNTSTTEAWSIFDSTRNDYNGPDAKMLLPSSNAAESTSANRDIDFLSNGFKIRASSGLNPNTNSGNVYIFAAFASHPFGGSGVSPATAR